MKAFLFINIGGTNPKGFEAAFKAESIRASGPNVLPPMRIRPMIFETITYFQSVATKALITHYGFIIPP